MATPASRSAVSNAAGTSPRSRMVVPARSHTRSSGRGGVGTEGIVGEHPAHATVPVELHTFDADERLDALIVEHEAARAGVGAEEHEMEIGEARERLAPVNPKSGLAPDRHLTGAEHGLDQWRGHFDVLGVVAEDAIQVMAVPCRDPPLAEVLGLGLGHELEPEWRRSRGSISRLRRTSVVGRPTGDP